MPPKNEQRVTVYAMIDGEAVPVRELADVTLDEAEIMLERYDFIRVTRCRDCKYFCDYQFCKNAEGNMIDVTPDDFCSWAERKEDEANNHDDK